MRSLVLLLSLLVSSFAIANDLGSEFRGAQVGDFEHWIMREEANHAGYCAQAVEQEAARRVQKVKEMTMTSMPVEGGMAPAAIGTLEDGTVCECTYPKMKVVCY